MSGAAVAIGLVAALAGPAAAAAAHDGPPYPIVSDRIAGPYHVSVWTDPDTTDDGSSGGQFWVRIERREANGKLPAETRARVSIRPLDRPGQERMAAATPVRADLTNQFAALVMDHEGRFAVRVVIDGPLGIAAIDSEVTATYDLRPPAALLLVYLAPFVAIGLLWGRLAAQRRTVRSRGRA
jgi:hypothetical protein